MTPQLCMHGLATGQLDSGISPVCGSEHYTSRPCREEEDKCVFVFGDPIEGPLALPEGRLRQGILSECLKAVHAMV